MVDTTENRAALQPQTYGANMDPVIGGALIGGGAQLLGGGLNFLGASGANSANAAAAQNAFNQQMAFAKLQFYEGEHQDIFERIQAAYDYGVSPLVTLGAPSYSPGAIPAFTGGNSVNALSGLGSALGGAGQDISRAIGATQDRKEREATAAATLARVTRNDDVDNRVKTAQVNMLEAQANYYNSRAYSTPTFPTAGPDAGHIVPGQGSTPVPDKIPQADQAYVRSDGRMEYQPAPGTPASQGDFFNSALNFARNRLSGLAGGTGQTLERVDSDMRRLYPDAIGYVKEGLGTYRPIYSGQDFPKGFRPLPDWR